MTKEEIDKLVNEAITKLISEEYTPEKMEAFWEAHSKQKGGLCKKI